LPEVCRYYYYRSANLPEELACVNFFFFFYSEQSNLSIYWTDFHVFFDSSRDVAMATNFVAKLLTPLHLSLWHSETEWDNAV